VVATALGLGVGDTIGLGEADALADADALGEGPGEREGVAEGATLCCGGVGPTVAPPLQPAASNNAAKAKKDNGRTRCIAMSIAPLSGAARLTGV
jgi:hypothetical protein